MVRLMMRSRRRLTLASEAVALAAVAVALCACSGGPAQPAARARVYTSYKACLLTDAHGISGQPATQVWSGMEDASLRTHAKVSYLAVAGPATKANALTFLGSLLVMRCDVIVAADSAEQSAVLADASRYPAVRFVVAGDADQGPVGGTNVSAVSAGQSGGLRGAVAAAITADASSAS